MFRLTPMVKNLLIANIGIWFLQKAFPIITDLFALRVVFSDEFGVHQFFSYMWLHSVVGWRHIIGNMIILFFAGPMLEMVWGSKRFLIFYLACGIGGGVLFGVADLFEKRQIKSEQEIFQSNPDPDTFRLFAFEYGKPLYDSRQLYQFAEDYYDAPETYESDAVALVDRIASFYIDGQMIGASGAIFGLLMALLMLFPNTEIYLYFLFPIKVKYLVSALLVYEVYSEINRAQGDTVAHLAHLGGAAIAYFLIKYWQQDKTRLY
ncbi:MAG: rhomboid family intramembrane serine protease [Bacteroidota bacterium]